MKVLLIHTTYQIRGGEDVIFDQENELLGQTEEVRKLAFKNYSGIRGFFQLLMTIWNLGAAQRIRRALIDFQPDIVQVHNWHYAIGPLAIRVIKKRGIPVVLNIQNFRILCPSATLLHQGRIFLDSLHSSFPWKAVRKRVYHHSYFLTFWLSLVIWFHKKVGTWQLVDRFIVVTQLAKELFVCSNLGIPETRFVIKPNFIPDPGAALHHRDSFFLFLGRLSEEKGIDCLLKAFEGTSFTLFVGGDGPLKERVIKASQTHSTIKYLGLLNGEEVRQYLRKCSILIFPSIWYEGMPMILIEAFASGAPVIASNLGAMKFMIQDGHNGLFFSVGDFDALRTIIEHWDRLSLDEKIRFSKNARLSYQQCYTPERNKAALLSIYKDLMN